MPIPARVGEDISVAYYPGQIYRPKAVGARILSLGMRISDTPAYLGGVEVNGEGGSVTV
jgi:hypothetical protein